MGNKQEQSIITVFGSSLPKPGSKDYEQAREIGRLLAQEHFAVATGGYEGSMAAVSQGAAEAGGHVIGVSSTRIEKYRQVRLNKWVSEEIRYPTLRERLIYLVENNQGMVVLPGGVGTLSEFALAWSLLQVGEISPRPLILLGDFWQDWFTSYSHSKYITEKHRSLVYLASSPEESISYLRLFKNVHA